VTTPEEAALAGNGMPVMILAVDGIQIVSLVIGALVIGVFFYITTLHKTAQIAAIKALGASNGYVYRQLLLQITILVTVAAGVGVALALGAGSSMPPTMAFDPQADRWLVSLAAVYAMAYLGSLFSLRSILKIDPATALDHSGH
jgi:ABC-type antimicrobial peptide transport system, permease component